MYAFRNAFAVHIQLTRNRTDLEDVLRINVLGVHAVTSAFLPLLKKGNLRKIITV